MYLCGSITADPSTLRWRDDAVLALTDHGIAVRCPMRGKSLKDVRNNGLNTTNTLLEGRFVDRDLYDVRHSDCLLVNWHHDPGRQSIGTWVEIGIAVERGIPVIIVDTTDTVSHHPFIQRLCVKPFTNMNDAIRYAVQMLKER